MQGLGLLGNYKNEVMADNYVFHPLLRGVATPVTGRSEL